MKHRAIWMVVMLILPFLNSCEEDYEVLGFDNPNSQWTDSATLRFTSEQDKTGFVYNVNNSTGEEFWGQTEAKFNVEFFSNQATVANISKEEVYNIFKNQYTSNQTDIKIGDIFEIKWVITGTDGQVYDSRTDCVGFNCSYGFDAKEAIVDTWIGEFEYKWIEVGPGTVRYSYDNINVGSTGIVEFIPGSTEGQYDVLDMSFGGAYGGPRGGTLTYDVDNQILTIISAESYYNSIWEVVSVTEDVLTVYWTNNFTTRYSEYGTIELRRSDGLKWPTGLSIVKL